MGDFDNILVFQQIAQYCRDSAYFASPMYRTSNSHGLCQEKELKLPFENNEQPNHKRQIIHVKYELMSGKLVRKRLRPI